MSWSDGFEDGDASGWTLTNSSVTSNQSYEGTYSLHGDQNGPAANVLAETTIVSGGNQLQSFEYYWREISSGSSGGGVALINSNGDVEVGFVSDNPAWHVYDDGGWTEIYSGDGYERWIEVSVTEFDWSSGEYTVTFTDQQSGTSQSRTGNLRHGVDIESLEIRSYESRSGWDGSNFIMWFDEFSATWIDSPSSPSVSASVNSNDEIGLSINPPSDWGGEEGNYHVQLNRDGNGWTNPSGGPTEPDSSTTNPTYGPSSDSSYGSQVGIDSEFQFRARAENSAGNSDWAYSSSVYTDPIPPHNPSVSRPDANTFEFSWDVRSDIAEGVQIRYREDTGEGYGSWSYFANSTGWNGNVSVNVSSNSKLSEDARYQFFLRHYRTAPNQSETYRWSERAYADYGNEGNVYFEDDFEDGDISDWYDDGDGGSVQSGNSNYDSSGIDGAEQGTYYLQNWWGQSAFYDLGDLSAESDVIIKFAFAMSGTGEINWYDGSTWHTLKSYGDEYNEQGWTEETIRVPDSYLSSDNRIEVGCNGGGGDEFLVDRIVVSDILHEYTKPAAPSNPLLETESTSKLQGSWDLNHTFADDVETYFGPVDGSLSGTNRSHALVSTAFDGLDDGTEYELEVNVAVHQYRHGEKETEWDSDRTDTVSARTILDAVRSVESHAGPITSSAERTIDVDRSTESHTGSVSSESDRVLEYERSTESHVNPVSSSSSRISELHRTTATTGEASIDSMQALRPVFPSEESLDVQWDFDVDQMAFATEWLDEDSHIPTEDRDGVGVVLNGRLDTTIDVWVQYDETGDGTPDVTSSRQEMSRTTKTLTFDDSSLFGEDGWYRVVVQGLRDDDVINQVDVGPVHENL